MPEHPSPHAYTVFVDDHRVATGWITEVAAAAQPLAESASRPVFFDNTHGDVVDVDLRGTPAALKRRLKQRFGTPPAAELDEPPAPPIARGPGRPKLGVIAREVTLLPRHWAWLDSQPGSASVVLRRLVEEASRVHAARDRRRKAQEVSYRFISTMAGNRPHFEEAARALFAGDRGRFLALIDHWPSDIGTHAAWLAGDAFTEPATMQNP